MIISYLKNSFRRKIARRFTREYPSKLDTFDLEEEGKIEFANWENPLAQPITLFQSNINFFKRFIKPGDFVIDIGANIGDTTVPMALAAGNNGLTLAFDPNPYLYKILSENAALNKDKTNIHPYPYAISTDEEEFYFASSEASFANGGISKERVSQHGKFVLPEKIKGIELFSFLKKEYPEWLSNLSFIKIDTEGYDKEILKSISTLIKTYRPVLVAEVFRYLSEDEKRELYEVINQHKYDMYMFGEFIENTEVQRLNHADDIIRWENLLNLYAIPVELE